jgi:hypothetical protein
VKLINTDGMAFIGPGSEWFWTAVSGLVLAVTFIAIYRQLRMARSASAREQVAGFDREWDSERLLRHRLAIQVALRDGADPAYLPAGSAAAVANFWETIGLLARSGDLDRKAIYTGYGSMGQLWWAYLAPQIQRWRIDRDPRAIGDFEWLVGIMADMDRRAGVPPLDEALIISTLGGYITSLEDRLRVEQSLRTVVIAEAVPAAPPATVAATEGRGTNPQSRRVRPARAATQR